MSDQVIKWAIIKWLKWLKWLLISCISLSLSGCPDTTIPTLGGERGARVCSVDELQAFRETSTKNEREDLWIVFVDVGQGDATWIRTPGTRDLDAKDILVDTGNCVISSGKCGYSSQVNDQYDSDGVGALIDFMVEHGWIIGSPIDYLVATHPDKDHYGGTWEILREYRVGAFLSSGITNTDHTYLTALDSVSKEPNLIDLTPVSERGLNVKQGGEFITESWGRNITVHLLSANQNTSDDNRSSIVLSIEFQGVRILLTGDSEDGLDRDLLAIDDAYRVSKNVNTPSAVPSLLRADVLKAGHHGGKDTNTQALLDRVFPESSVRRYAIISAGRRDQLPAEDTVDRLLNMVGEFGLYRTDRNDENKDRATSPGDDHVLLRVSAEGDLTLCYAYPD